MQKYLNIYMKELQSQIKTYLISLFTFMALCGIVVWVFVGSYGPVEPGAQKSYVISSGGKLTLVCFFLLLFFFSQLLFFLNSLKDKYLSGKNYLLYSVPAKRYTPLLINFIVFVTYLIVTFTVMFLWSFAVMGVEIQQMKDEMIRSKFPSELMDNEHLQLGNGILYWVIHHSRFFFTVKLLGGLTFFVSGLLLFIKILRYKLKWFNSFIQTVAALVIFVLFCEYGLIDLNSTNNLIGFLSMGSCIAAGTIFLILGLIVYEKHGQI